MYLRCTGKTEALPILPGFSYTCLLATPFLSMETTSADMRTRKAAHTIHGRLSRLYVKWKMFTAHVLQLSVITMMLFSGCTQTHAYPSMWPGDVTQAVPGGEFNAMQVKNQVEAHVAAEVSFTNAEYVARERKLDDVYSSIDRDATDFSPSPSSAANTTRKPKSPGWKKEARKQTFVIIICSFGGAGVLALLIHGAGDWTSHFCSHPKFRKVRISQFQVMLHMNGEKINNFDERSDKAKQVEKLFVKGEESLKADIAADAAEAHKRLIERIKRGSRRVEVEKRRSLEITGGSSLKTHPLARRRTEMERLRRLHSQNIRKANSQSIFDADGDGDVDDDDLDIDGDGKIDDTEREMGRLAIQSAQSQRAQLLHQEDRRLKSEQRLDARLRKRHQEFKSTKEKEKETMKQKEAQIDMPAVSVAPTSSTTLENIV